MAAYKRGLRSTFCSRETFQNLLMFMYKVNRCRFLRFSFRAPLSFSLPSIWNVNALVYLCRLSPDTIGLVYYPLSEKKYWKIPRGVMVIPRKNIGFSSEEPKAPRKKIQYFSEGLPSTPSGIFQYFFSDKG